MNPCEKCPHLYESCGRDVLECAADAEASRIDEVYERESWRQHCEGQEP